MKPLGEVALHVYTVTEAEAKAGSVKNTATVSGATPGGEQVISEPSSTSTDASLCVGEAPGTGEGLSATGGASPLMWIGIAALVMLAGALLLMASRRGNRSRPEA